MISLDGNESDVLMRFMCCPSSDLNTLVQLEEIFTISEEMAPIFQGVVGIDVTTVGEIRRGMELARASRFGDLLRASPVSVELTGSCDAQAGVLFYAREFIWVSITPRRRIWRLISVDDFEKSGLAPPRVRCGGPLVGWDGIGWDNLQYLRVLCADIEKISINYDENGFFKAQLKTPNRSVDCSGAISDFHYCGAARRSAGELERPGACAFALL